MIWLALKLAESWKCVNWGSVRSGEPFCTNHVIISKQMVKDCVLLKKKKWQVDHAECKTFWCCFGKMRRNRGEEEWQRGKWRQQKASEWVKVEYMPWFSFISFKWWVITYLTNKEPQIVKLGLFPKEGGGFSLSAPCTEYRQCFLPTLWWLL